MKALVTGASSGIGEEFAVQLAAEGWDLVLIARRGELLEGLAAKLRNQNKVSVDVLVCDLSEPSAANSVTEFAPEIDLLVSNAGFGYPGDFGSKGQDDDTRLVQLNCMTPMQLAHYYLPKMKQAKSGKILFVSSSLGFQGVPHMAQYSATKGYLINLGEALHWEGKADGVEVSVLCPGATDTPGKDHFDIDYSKLPIKWMPVEKVVKTALKNLGKKSIIIPGLRNHFFSCIGGGLYTRKHVQCLMKKLYIKLNR
ncbi:MAG: short-subunit dehydrogenase [Cryomorphaceae bacterium]|jgi:short-subunit dehydrogenase